MTGPTIVLGWDGLDPELIETEAFGHVQRVETLVNPELGKPHTWELWPSMITGVTPPEHGVRAEAFLDGGFDSRLLSLVARVSKYTVPDALRWRVGRLLRDHGASFDFKRLEYYRDAGLPTVFDGYESLPIAVPNARSEFDDAVGLEQDRGAYLSQYLESAEGEGGTRRATVPIDTLRARVEADMAAKMGLVRANLHSGYDLIFVWLAYVDTLGHVAPTTSDPDAFMRDVYETAAAYTERLRAEAGEEATVLCVSDHGLQDGRHTEQACVCGPQEHVRSVTSVLDLPQVIDSVTTPAAARGGQQQPSGGVEDVRERLEDLGYI